MCLLHHLYMPWSLIHAPEVLPEPSWCVCLQLAQQEVGKDGLKLHQDPSVAVLAINCVRSRGGGDGRALGGGSRGRQVYHVDHKQVW